MNEQDIIRAVAENFAHEGVQRPQMLPDPWRKIWSRTEEALDACPYVEDAVKRACRDLPNRRALEFVILRAMPSEEEEYVIFGDESASLPPITWLWPGWIPRGMVTLLGANPGAGKSLLALDLARRIFHGLPWPDGQQPSPDLRAPASPSCLCLAALGTKRQAPLGTERQSAQNDGLPTPEQPGSRHRTTVPEGEQRRSCIYVDAEAVPQIQKARVDSWGMNKDRLYYISPEDSYGTIDFTNESHQDRLVRMCAALKPDLVVVDSLGTVSARGENNVEEVRALLAFLSGVAVESSCGMLLLHHLRKRGALPAGLRLEQRVGRDDFRGSSHITATARSVLALSTTSSEDGPDADGPRTLHVVKTNLGIHPPALELTFEPGDGGAPRLCYREAPRKVRPPTLVQQCADWLVQLLAEAGEPMRPGEVCALAEDAGFTRSVVHRARKSLEDKIVYTGRGSSPENRWGLAEKGGGEG